MSYDGLVLADGPMAYWTLREDLVGTSTVFPDLTGNGYDAHLYYGVASTQVTGPVVGRPAPYLTIEATVGGDFLHSDAVYMTHTAGLPKNGDPYTLEGWIKPDLGNLGWMAYINYGQINGYPTIGSDTRQNFSTFGAVETWDPANGVWFGYVGPWYDGDWHHVVWTDDAAGTVTCYCDGVQIGQDTAAGASNGYVPQSGDVLSIGDPGFDPRTGYYAGPGSEQWQGSVSHWAIYKKVLSAERVLAHYDARDAASSSTGLCVRTTATSLNLLTDGSGAPPTPTSPLTVVSSAELRARHSDGRLLWTHDGTTMTIYKDGSVARTIP